MEYMIDFESDLPLYVQLRNQIVIGISTGKLAGGAKLPTVREMAASLGINMMTVNKAYGQLKREGYIVTDRRRGASVQRNVAAASMAQREKLTGELTLLISEAKLQGISMLEFSALTYSIWK
jgi:DNA-binding transcriptional regulator YhcF (GntR family)